MTTFTLLIDSSPERYNAHFNAISFCRSALEQGHQIQQIFFFQDAVRIADSRLDLPADEWDPQVHWQQLATSHNLNLEICSAASQRRGLGGAESLEEAEEAEQAQLAEGFKIGGLGVLVKASISSDRVIQF
ncbi:sulfurtransferase complex subunit TusD [Echinimonas agarilytica]|uniref:Sulfurtransferase complex subunit TusD n=1 Tax=Echinimonas agarilytica TaxID=1215918 RepID=A0AA42B8P9_9GAMM|nr:sulfurtransferase complex subunit TusD [Echinimonas agarilytica]MCM2680753.1 sulfurtransferase complex subunit TusD [Echinimonas agarilytica]